MDTTSSDPDYDQLHDRIAEILDGEASDSTPDTDETAPEDTTEAGDQASINTGSNDDPGADGAADTSRFVPASGEVDDSESGDEADTGSEDAEPDQPVDAGEVC